MNTALIQILPDDISSSQFDALRPYTQGYRIYSWSRAKEIALKHCGSGKTREEVEKLFEYLHSNFPQDHISVQFFMRESFAAFSIQAYASQDVTVLECKVLTTLEFREKQKDRVGKLLNCFVGSDGSFYLDGSH